MNQNIIEETNRILAEIWSDSDPFDLVNEPESFFNVNDTFALRPKISTWDQDRETWLDQNPKFPNHINGKPHILLITGSHPKPCDKPIGDHYLLKAIKNKIDYFLKESQLEWHQH